MTTKQKLLCHATIHSFSALAGTVGAGGAQLPCCDNIIITPLQVTMIIGLGKIFGYEITENIARAKCASALAKRAGRALSQIIIGWFPIAGNIVNAGTAAGITEAIGWIMAEEFAQA